MFFGRHVLGFILTLTLLDVDVLNFALTLEHLENSFYSGALSKFSDSDFTEAGAESFARGRFTQIAAHEASHVQFLSSALGSAATQPCNYTLWVDFYSLMWEYVLTLFAARTRLFRDSWILARRSSKSARRPTPARPSTSPTRTTSRRRQRSSLPSRVTLLGLNRPSARALPGAPRMRYILQHVLSRTSLLSLQTPLDLNSVYTLASGFITSCPSTNPTLPVKANGKLTTTGTGAPGSQLTVAYTAPSSSSELYASFRTGLSAVVVPLNSSKTEFTVPSEGLAGYTYLLITTDKAGLDPNQTVAGPAIINISLNSQGHVAQDRL